MWAAPPQAAPGSEFTTSIALPTDQISSARLELVYDPAVLQVAQTGGKPPAPGVVGAPGRLTVQIDKPAGPGTAAPLEVRFRVIAKNAVSTELRFENIAAQDANGGSVPLVVPPSQTLKIVP